MYVYVQYIYIYIHIHIYIYIWALLCKNRKIVTIVMHKSYYAIIMRRRASGMNSNLKKGKKRKHIRKGGKNIYIYTMKEKNLFVCRIFQKYKEILIEARPLVTTRALLYRESIKNERNCNRKKDQRLRERAKVYT